MAKMTTATDREKQRIERLCAPGSVPLTFCYNGVRYCGVPGGQASPMQETDGVKTYTVTGGVGGLRVEAECRIYGADAAAAWMARFHCIEGGGLLNEVAVSMVLDAAQPVLLHGNGDTQDERGYTWQRDALTETVTLSPTTGTSCRDAFPYMRLCDGQDGWNLAVGWAGEWTVRFLPQAGGVAVYAGQKSLAAVLRPGETVVTPRLTVQAYSGGEDRARNLWRRFYLRHFLPEDRSGRPLGPRLCEHTLGVEGKPEFTGITEENQKRAIDGYRTRGLLPDIWWIDAGWYPCDYDWFQSGTWHPNYFRLPNGLGPVGEACEDAGMELLLWFEPERVYFGSDLSLQHPEFLLDGAPERCSLFYLGNEAALAYMTDTVDKLIKESHVRVYRQDFNFDPTPIYEKHDAPDRRGLIENFHIQGLYRFWDALRARNPGLWIDNCASGGRRNDLETLSHGAVPLHYTDVGYGNHPIKQKQHRQMFEWIPYFRAHNMRYDRDDGTYGEENRPVDLFAYHCALAPALSNMTEFDGPEAEFELGRQFIPVWRRCAEMMLQFDYYPLTECRGDARDWYAMRFDGGDCGFIQAIRNIASDADTLTVPFFAATDTVYIFRDALTGEAFCFDSEQLASEGLRFTLPRRCGQILFYTSKPRHDGEKTSKKEKNQ